MSYDQHGNYYPPPHNPYQPPVRNGVGVMGGAFAAAIVAGVVALVMHFGGISIGGATDTGSGVRVSIAGALPCQASAGGKHDNVHLTPARVPTCVAAKKYAKAKLVDIYGGKRGATEFKCLDKLWNGESKWSAWALNPSSGAYGVAQTLPGIHKNSPPHDQWKPQVDWGINYINHGSSHFNSPCEAWIWWNNQDPHWY